MTAALTGVRIADFSWVGAGPRATKDLADYGATVIKIESRQRLDLGRVSPPFKDGVKHHDGSAFFAISNTSKRSVTINLADPRGVEVARRLVAWADVVVENFGKGYMERIGLSYDELERLRPGIILVSVSVAGRTGPAANLRGYGNSAAAMSGLAALSGWPDRAPHMPPFAYGDVVAPIFATIAVLAALEHRRQTGRGQHIDVSQVEPLVHVLSDRFVERQLADRVERQLADRVERQLADRVEHPLAGHPEKPGNRSAQMAPHGIYPCRGNDEWCAIAVRSDEQWQQMSALMGSPVLAERFGSLATRKQAENELDDAVAAWTRGFDKHELATLLADRGIAAEAVQNGREVFNDPELAAAGHYVRTPHSVLGECAMPAPPVRFSESTVHVGSAPLLGEHNHDVFVGMLGMTEQEVTHLADAGVLS